MVIFEKSAIRYKLYNLKVRIDKISQRLLICIQFETNVLEVVVMLFS